MDLEYVLGQVDANCRVCMVDAPSVSSGRHAPLCRHRVGASIPLLTKDLWRQGKNLAIFKRNKPLPVLARSPFAEGIWVAAGWSTVPAGVCGRAGLLREPVAESGAVSDCRAGRKRVDQLALCMQVVSSAVHAVQ